MAPISPPPMKKAKTEKSDMANAQQEKGKDKVKDEPVWEHGFDAALTSVHATQQQKGEIPRGKGKGKEKEKEKEEQEGQEAGNTNNDEVAEVLRAVGIERLVPIKTPSDVFNLLHRDIMATCKFLSLSFAFLF